MMDRQTVLKAAEAVGGVALLLPEQYDSALTGYTSQFKCNHKSTPLMVGVYDMDAIVYGPGGPVEGDDSWQDREDELLTCINRMPAPPILQHTMGGMMIGLKAETIVPQGSAITLQMYPKADVDKVIADEGLRA